MSDEPPLRIRQAAEATAYAAVVAAVVVVASIVVATVVYGPGLPALVAAAWGMLAVSIGLLGMAGIRLRPRPRKRLERKQLEDGDQRDVIASSESYFTAFVMRVPPARWIYVHPEDRIDVGWKIGLASLMLLAVALLVSYVTAVYSSSLV